MNLETKRNEKNKKRRRRAGDMSTCNLLKSKLEDKQIDYLNLGYNAFKKTKSRANLHRYAREDDLSFQNP